MIQMKNKLWIKTRVFLSFSIFTLIIINIFSYFLYFFVEKNVKNNIKKDLYNEFQTIKTFIDLQNTYIFSLPIYEIEKINSMWFFFHIWNNVYKTKDNYKLWFNVNHKNEIIYKWIYSWYIIIIWKNINDLINFKKNIIEINLILNIFSLFIIFIISFIITKQVLKPLIKLSEYFSNYDINKNQNLIINNYWDTEIWNLTKTINKFTQNIRDIFESQQNFIQDTNHELKTPLMQIETNIDLIENKIDDVKIKNKLENIRKSIENINWIISNLWFILRWEEKIIKKENININYYLNDFIKNYYNISKKKNIKIVIIKKYDLIIENNTYYLDRLFWNIISNAIYYNKLNNIINIIINKNWVEINDKWIGINNEDLNKIFYRFYRNKDSNIYYKNWNWLWLTIVKKICDLFWWKIKIYSTEGKWSSFLLQMSN